MLLFTLLIDMNGYTGQLILDDFRNSSDQKIDPKFSTRISRMKTNVLAMKFKNQHFKIVDPRQDQ